MKTIEEKARIYTKTAAPLMAYSSGLILNAYIAGATEALASQWRSVVDELPSENEEVLCRMASNGAIVSGYIAINKEGQPIVATNPDFHFEDYGSYECTHWMPIPELPKTESV